MIFIYHGNDALLDLPVIALSVAGLYIYPRDSEPGTLCVVPHAVAVYGADHKGVMKWNISKFKKVKYSGLVGFSLPAKNVEMLNPSC